MLLTEGGPGIGLGHLMRCIAIAESARGTGMRPLFFVNKNTAVSQILDDRRFRFKEIRNPFIRRVPRVFGKIQDAPVLIDSKKDVSCLIGRLQKQGCTVTLLDNVTRARLAADNVIYPMAHYIPRELSWKKAKGLVRHGERYFPLRREFSSCKPAIRKRYILITMGGADFNNITRTVLESLEGRVGQEPIVVCIGKAFKHKAWLERYRRVERNTIRIVREPKNFARLLSGARLVITAFGVTIYEAAYYRVPVFVIYNYPDDQRYSRLLERLGLCETIGYYKTVRKSDIIGRVRSFLGSKRGGRRARGRKVTIDAKGCRRILAIMSGPRRRFSQKPR